ncbi:MAG: hypothetical protein QOI38_647 [Sphingomonadales bacterium]|jgi:hypothetical protein|nr:hypothetical protein [Sphingomonadales bacterium]
MRPTAHVEKMQHVGTIRPSAWPAALGKAKGEVYMPLGTGDESVKRFGGMAAFGGAALVAASLLLLSPASAQSDRAKAQRAASLRAGPAGSFTPAVADPRLAAALARRGNGAGSFRITPTSAAADRRQPLRVAVRARAAAPQGMAGVQTASATPVTAITPTSYNLGASVGWRRFAISGDVAESHDGVISGRRASAQVGMSYRANQRITARIQASAEQTEGRQRIVTDDQAYAVDVGGSYSIARNLDVTGGVRYRIARDRIEPLAADQRRDSQAVYIGTAFRF